VSGAVTRIPLAEARALAEEVVEMLRPACERIEIAGSIRRGKADVGDLEIVAVAKTEPTLNLFGERTGGERNLLNELCDRLMAQGVLLLRLDKNGRAAYGSKYMRLTYRGTPLDLFATTPHQWGVIFLIRTGPADYSHRLVTPTTQQFTDSQGRRWWGLMPPGMNVKDGALWRGGQIIPTPEEWHVFRALGLAYLEPHERTPAAARQSEGAGG
jgi:DNA polymerase/3'-5' exonuclease PolX